MACCFNTTVMYACIIIVYVICAFYFRFIYTFCFVFADKVWGKGVKFRLQLIKEIKRKPCHAAPLVEVKPTTLLPLNFSSFPSLIPFLPSFLSLYHLPVKNCFRVSSRGRSKAHPYSLQANDSFSKQQWITCLRQAIVQSRDRTAQTSQSQLSPHPDPALYHIAELSLSSDTEMADHTSR